MFILGLTGNISCGKSSVSKILKSKGISIIDADLLSCEIYTYEDVMSKMKEEFPQAIVDGRVDRKILGQIVFPDRKSLDKLNDICQKKIYDLILKAIQSHKKERLLVIDAALLIEGKYDNMLDKLILVYCDEDKQVERLIKRDCISREDAMNRINSQMSQEDKRGYADYIIDNSGDYERLQLEVEKLVKQIGKWTCESEGR